MTGRRRYYYPAAKVIIEAATFPINQPAIVVVLFLHPCPPLHFSPSFLIFLLPLSFFFFFFFFGFTTIFFFFFFFQSERTTCHALFLVYFSLLLSTFIFFLFVSQSRSIFDIFKFDIDSVSARGSPDYFPFFSCTLPLLSGRMRACIQLKGKQRYRVTQGKSRPAFHECMEFFIFAREYHRLASLEPSNRQVNVRFNVVADVKIFINARDYVWRLQIAA